VHLSVETKEKVNMHLSEFKAWFEGFTDGIDGIPSPRQWNKIKERVAEITNDYTPATVFVDRYARPYWHHYQPYWNTMLCAQSGNAPTETFANNAAASPSQDWTVHLTAQQPTQADWRALGAAELKAVQ
jgi:hypothetical protein